METMTTTKIQEHATQLVTNGAGYTVVKDGTYLDFLLAKVYWLDNPNRLRWVSLFPEHQGHVHETPYDKLTEEAGGLGVALRQKGKVVGYITTIAEMDGLDYTKSMDAWRSWLRYMDFPNSGDNLDDFVENAL